MAHMCYDGTGDTDQACVAGASRQSSEFDMARFGADKCDVQQYGVSRHGLTPDAVHIAYPRTVETIDSVPTLVQILHVLDTGEEYFFRGNIYVAMWYVL